jgi:hypothetical protein
MTSEKVLLTKKGTISEQGYNIRLLTILTYQSFKRAVILGRFAMRFHSKSIN